MKKPNGKSSNAKRHPPYPDGGQSLRAGDELETRIERILPGGLGLAHAAGRTMLVQLAAPGDVVRVRIDTVRGKTLFASIVKILEPSAVRASPPCPYFGRCGGCDFQQLTYPAQLESKRGIIRDCLQRIARLEIVPEIHITASPDPLNYRLRAEWQLDAIHHRLGYFERNSHRICDVTQCPILQPELENALRDARADAATWDLEAKELRATSGDGKTVSVVPVYEAEAFNSPPSSGEALIDNGELGRTVGAETYRFNEHCFFQVNPALLPALINEALRHATTRNAHTALDLYCGVGLFTLPLARLYERVIGIESNPTAAHYAAQNLHHASLTNARIEVADVAVWMSDNATTYSAMIEDVELVLLDPPRAGVEPDIINALISLQPSRIVYVSCDPATLARDIHLLSGSYSLERIAAFDMFPQTHHVETVAHLVRRCCES
ncbi:MAG: class I SAM-dependent RNA methyltransferase [Pyrinomonadaceae bacterium MAG19_C2-C3]|nr:class I SAM-dependent RNA methyltransferase [Pyrinomonadaceae bacterium MAG19_C2-C3]